MCPGHNRQGNPCGNTAGKGTDHVGWGLCRSHGGSSPGGIQQAIRLEAEVKALKLGDELPVDPGEALLWTVRVASGSLAIIRDKLAELQQDQSPTPAQIIPLAKLLSTQAEQLARISKVASEAGVEERRLQLDALRLDKLAEAIQAAVSDAELHPDARARLDAALHHRLGELSDDDLRPRPKELRA